MPALAEAGYHAVAPWLRGYAPTSQPTDGIYHQSALGADAWPCTRCSGATNGR